MSKEIPAGIACSINATFAGFVCLMVYFCTGSRANDKKRYRYEEKVIKLNQMLIEEEKNIISSEYNKLDNAGKKLIHRKTFKNLAKEDDDLNLHQLVIATKHAVKDQERPLDVLKHERDKIE